MLINLTGEDIRIITTALNCATTPNYLNESKTQALKKMYELNDSIYNINLPSSIQLSIERNKATGISVEALDENAIPCFKFSECPDEITDVNKLLTYQSYGIGGLSIKKCPSGNTELRKTFRIGNNQEQMITLTKGELEVLLAFYIFKTGSARGMNTISSELDAETKTE